jgi:hypothetical protein
MINEPYLALIADSVELILKFQSTLIGDSNKLDKLNQNRLKKFFHSFETQWKVKKTRQKCFEILFKQHFTGKNSLDRYEHLLFIFKFKYEEFLEEKFPLNTDSLKSVKTLGLEEWIRDIQRLSNRERVLTIQNSFFQKEDFFESIKQLIGNDNNK